MSDLIKREDIKELMRKYGFKAPDMTIHEFVEDCLPSAYPEQTAKVKSKNYYGTTTNTVGYFTCVGKCGNCECEVIEHYVYCPICGARLEWK